MTDALPLRPGTWTVDPSHSGVHFKIRHLGLTNVRGRFDRFDATLTVGEHLDDVAIEARIDLSSVNTNQPDRDAHLRSTDFFAVDTAADMIFRSTRIVDEGNDRYTLLGDLTIRDITRPVSLDVEFAGLEAFPTDGSTHAGFSASGEINREDFGIDFNLPLGVDKVALAQKVKLELDLQFASPQP